MLVCEHPVWLWIALAVALAAAGALVAARRRSWRWRVAGVLLPLAAAVFIAPALAAISLASAPRVVVLLDFSASTREQPWRDPAFVRQLAEKHVGAGQHLTVVACGGKDCQILLNDITPADAWPARFPWEDSPAHAATDLAAALAWRLPQELENPRRVAARWLVTDGLAARPSLPAGGGDKDNPPLAVTILPPTAPDAAIRELILRPAADDPTAVEILIQVRALHIPASAPLNAQLRVLRDGQIVATSAVAFPASAGRVDVTRWITLRDRPAPGALPHHYEATIELPHDAWPENDHASALWTIPTTTPRILVIGQHNIESATPATFIPTNQFSASSQQLAAEGWQAIILNDVPARGSAALSPTATREIDRFVRFTGGGLLILGQGHAFGPGHYGETVPDLLDALSPLASRPPSGSNLHAVFLLDASASMNDPAPGATEKKFALLSHAVEQAAGLLGPSDRVTVIAFNRTSQRVFDGPVRADSALRQKLAALEPGGETAPDSALADVTAALASPGRHVLFFITDGEIPAMSIARWKTLVDSSHTQLFIIAPPADSPTSTIQQLVTAIPAAMWSKTPDPAAWGQTLQQLLADQLRGNLETAPPAPPLAWRFPDEPAAHAATAWTRTWMKPEALPLATADIPVAALAQRGLGKVAAITLSDLSSAPAQQLLQRALRAIAAPPGDRRFTVAAHHENDGTWQITADGITDPAAPAFLNHQSLYFRSLADPDTLMPFTQTAPGHYALRTLAPQGLSAVIIRKTATDPPEQLVARLQSATVETTEWPATLTALDAHDFAAGTAMLSPSPADSTRWNIPATATLSLTPAFYLAAILAALTALWLRK